MCLFHKLNVMKNSYTQTLTIWFLTFTVAYLNLGQLLGTLGKINEAEDTLRKCSELDITGLKDPRTHETTRITALLHLGRLYAEQGRYQDAVHVYRDAIRKMPDYYQPQVIYTNVKALPNI